MGCLVAASALGFSPQGGGPALETAWRSGSGLWTDDGHWSHGLPTPFQFVAVGGDSRVVVPEGTYLAGDLEVGLRKSDRARVEVDGGQLILMQDSLRVGEYTGGEGVFVLKRGAMHCVMDVFVGAATASSGRANKGTLVVEGGSFLGRTSPALTDLHLLGMRVCNTSNHSYNLSTA